MRWGEPEITPSSRELRGGERRPLRSQWAADPRLPGVEEREGERDPGIHPSPHLHKFSSMWANDRASLPAREGNPLSRTANKGGVPPTAPTIPPHLSRPALQRRASIAIHIRCNEFISIPIAKLISASNKAHSFPLYLRLIDLLCLFLLLPPLLPPPLTKDLWLSG